MHTKRAATAEPSFPWCHSPVTVAGRSGVLQVFFGFCRFGTPLSTGRSTGQVWQRKQGQGTQWKGVFRGGGSSPRLSHANAAPRSPVAPLPRSEAE